MVIDWQGVNPAVTTQEYGDFSIKSDLAQNKIGNPKKEGVHNILNLG